MADPELRALLIGELRRHEASLRMPELEAQVARRVLHAAKGSAGVAGERALFDALARIEKRVAGGESAALAEAAELLAAAISNLEEGKVACPDTWPLPPADLRPPAIPAATAARYGPEMHDRIALLDEVLADTGDPVAALERAFRHIHTMKGAASTVGDDVLAWFCHGLETRVRRDAGSEAAAREALTELMRWRAMLSQMVSDPGRALESLRAMSNRTAPSTRPPEGAPPRADAPHSVDTWLRVPGASLDRVLERIGRLSMSASELRSQAAGTRELARRLRAQRSSLLEAHRLIGPPRPWGAPAAAITRMENVASELGSAAETLERVASLARLQARTVRQDVAASQADLGAMRQAAMQFVFEPARAAIEAMAQREGRLVHVTVSGATLPIDRRLAEALVDPVLQLARNAVAHGLEPPGVRLAAGKSDVGTVALSAELRGVHLVVTVQDDGAGVDGATVRKRAVRAGAIGEELAEQADDEMLMNLLFLPGLTTRKGPDELAGRGVGLDLAQHSVRRLGGRIRILNRPGRGLDAIIDVPLAARGVVSVLWVTSLGHTFALSSSNVLRVRQRADAAISPPALARCIDPSWVGMDSPGYVIDVGREIPGDSVSFCVASVSAIEQVAVRPVSPLIATAGPYAGVIMTSVGAPALLIDPLLVADRMRSLLPRSFPPPPPSSRRPAQH
ncbi:MAG: Hpt domain-containing protein [Deltaproteobacteria bacterium]|nr:Hpt domain-containing protein [Deltaproteobacteria bacterium]